MSVPSGKSSFDVGFTIRPETDVEGTSFYVLSYDNRVPWPGEASTVRVASHEEIELYAKAQELAAEVAQLREWISERGHDTVTIPGRWPPVHLDDCLLCRVAALGVSRPGQEQEKPLFTIDDLSVELRGGMRMRDPEDDPGQEQEGQ